MTTTHDAVAVKLSDVSVDFASDGGSGTNVTQILSGVSLEVDAGEFVVLVGKSGCGKTTILNMVAGLLEPTTGTVTISDDAKQGGRLLSYMFARDALLPWRTAQRNVELVLELDGVDRAERRTRALELLESLGMSHAAQRYPWQLSQGMRQRVALARTWVLEPRVILMDEPFAALDAQTRVVVQRDFLKTWQERRPSVVFVTHDISEALLLADRVVVVNGGKIANQFKVTFERPRGLESLLADPEFNRLRKAVGDAIA